MADAGILTVVAQVAGIGGIALGVLLLVFRDIIRRNIFPKLSRHNAYSLLRLMVVLVWSIALVGIVAWIYTSRATVKSNEGGIIRATPSPVESKPATKVFAPEDEIVHREFDSKNKWVRFSIKGIIINNRGDADDLITIKSSLLLPNLKEEDASHSYGGDFELTDQTGRKLPRPFILPKGANLELNCSMRLNYSERSAGVFEKKAMRRLTITFEGETKPSPSLNFCFEDFYTPDFREYFSEECPTDS